MFTTLRLYYYRGLTLRDHTVDSVKGIGRGIYGGVISVGTTWRESPSIFQRSPLDAIAEQRLFEIERNFLKLNGFEYPPIRPPGPCPGYIRVEYYTEMNRMYQGKWECWGDVPLQDTGELDIECVKHLFALDPNHFVMIDPVRWKDYPIGECSRLSPIAIHNATYGSRIPLRFVEIDLPKITKLKRTLRAHALIMFCMFKATYNLLWHLRAYDEYQFNVPLPRLFLVVYNLARCLHPKTRPHCFGQNLDVISSPVETCSIEIFDQERFTSLLSGPSRSQLWYASLAQSAIILWLVAAEVIACKQQH